MKLSGCSCFFVVLVSSFWVLEAMSLQDLSLGVWGVFSLSFVRKAKAA